MPNSVYRVTEIVGTSSRSWEEAAKTAVQTAARSLRDLRVAEVSALDMTVVNGKVATYRAKVKLSFKFEAPPARQSVARKRAAGKRAARR